MKCLKIKQIILLIVFISCMSFSLAADFGYNNLGLPQLQPEEITTTTTTSPTNTSNVNSSNYWDSLDTPDDIDWISYLSTYLLNFFDQWLNTTSDVTFNSVNVTTDVTANSFIGDGSQLTGITGGIWTNVSNTATFEGQINVTSDDTFMYYEPDGTLMIGKVVS